MEALKQAIPFLIQQAITGKLIQRSHRSRSRPVRLGEGIAPVSLCVMSSQASHTRFHQGRTRSERPHGWRLGVSFQHLLASPHGFGKVDQR